MDKKEKLLQQRVAEGLAKVMADPEKRKQYLDLQEKMKAHKPAALIGDAIFDENVDRENP